VFTSSCLRQSVPSYRTYSRVLSQRLRRPTWIGNEEDAWTELSTTKEKAVSRAASERMAPPVHRSFPIPEHATLYPHPTVVKCRILSENPGGVPYADGRSGGVQGAWCSGRSTRLLSTRWQQRSRVASSVQSRHLGEYLPASATPSSTKIGTTVGFGARAAANLGVTVTAIRQRRTAPSSGCHPTRTPPPRPPARALRQNNRSPCGAECDGRGLSNVV